MKNYKISAICSLVAAVCFLLSYFIGGELIKLILACAWFCIAVANLIKLRNNRN